MRARIPTTTALLLATGVALPQAHADDAPAVADLVGFEDSSRPSEPPALPSFDTPPAPALPAPRAPSSPRFQLAVGPYTSTRTLAFAVDATTPSDQLPATSPQSTVVGAQVEAAVFPAGRHDARGRLVGPGITAAYRHSLGASATFDDLDEPDALLTLPVVDSGWSLGVRYRQPLGPVLIEAGLDHASASHRVDERPPWLELPDAEYRSLAAAVRLEVTVGAAAQVGLGARYHHVLDAGELMSPAAYGGGAVAAFDLDAGVDVPLTDRLFATAALSYRQVTMAFAGDGDLAYLDEADVPDVVGATDRAIDAHVGLGVRY
ncbi:MAG: hypothetical protein R3B06_05180 [Kofleriaceae bacterium]